MQKTLGGDRLGSGKKMKVDLHNYERSSHDLSYLWRSTMSAGTLVPFMKILAQPGDTFDINLECDIKTHPTVGPLFGSYKVQLDTFIAPIRLYHSALHNNKLEIGLKMNTVKLPVSTFEAQQINPANIHDWDNAQVNPSCILSYLGIRGIGDDDDAGGVQRDFQMVPWLAYWEIYKNYYANKQEGIGYVIHATPAGTAGITNVSGNTLTSGGPFNFQLYPTTGSPASFTDTSDTLWVTYTGTTPDLNLILLNTNLGWKTLYELTTGNFTDTGTVVSGYYDAGKWGQVIIDNYRIASNTDNIPIAPRMQVFDLKNIDTMREEILATAANLQFNTGSIGIPPYYYIDNGTFDRMYSQEGLALKTYQSDLFNNWLKTEWLDGTTGINVITAVDTSGGSFTIDQLNLSKKVYDMLNRIVVSGGSYDDYLDAVYTGNKRFTRAESPMYMGGLIRELVFQEVVSNSQSTDQPLGTLAGKGIMAQKKKGGNIVIKVDEPSYIIGIISLTPRIDYSQGNDWDTSRIMTMADIHVPALDEIGFQELITEQLAWWSTKWDAITGKWVTRSAGKQPAWINYMTAVNKTFGNFAIADNEMFMTLNRRYEQGGTNLIKDLTTYIDPTKYNFIFAETALDAQNFWAQIAVDIEARRLMSAKVMPNL